MTDFAARIEAATSAEDWTALAAIDRELAKALPELARQGLRSPAEKTAMAHLRKVHRASIERCGQAAADVNERLVGLRTHKEGWLAYAMGDQGSAS
jgi:hypothetical protein